MAGAKSPLCEGCRETQRELRGRGPKRIAVFLNSTETVRGFGSVSAPDSQTFDGVTHQIVGVTINKYLGEFPLCAITATNVKLD